MFSVGFRMNCEDRLEVQGSTPLGSRNCGRWFSIKVRPLWGPRSAAYMPNTNTKWLIEPKFDAPFHFENGTADVLYYGQRRKINENLQISEAKGEFVE